MQIKIIAKLSAEAIQSPALPLQSIDYVHRSHSLPLGMLGVGDRVTYNVLKENLRQHYQFQRWLPTFRTPLVSS